MIQEMLGGGTDLIQGERKNISIAPPPTASTTTTPATSSAAETQNPRCPRCDSSNTKFCYYNNYNLTQPRHFCKTCRRYWTKGGALRNVPIGGGCRKNKATSVTSVGKLKTVSSEIEKSGFISGFDQSNSHLLALLGPTQNPNPNPMSNFVNVKEEGVMINGSHMSFGLDPLRQVPSFGMCNSFWRNNQQQNGFFLGEVQNTGIPEVYQRLRSSANYNYHEHSPLIVSNVDPSSSSSTIVGLAPIAGGELGYYNPARSWSDPPTSNGASYY